MSLPITWGGSTSVGASASVDSDPISLDGIAGFSAIVTEAELANGNLQVMVSNGGPPVSLQTLSVNVLSGEQETFTFSFESQFYDTAFLRWTPTGPPSTGTLSGDWSVSATPPAPSPPPPSAAAPAGGTPTGTAATQSYLTGIMLDLFPPSWIPDATKGQP